MSPRSAAGLSDPLERDHPPASFGTDKVMSLSEAVRTLVRPGTALHLAYSDARPNAALMEVVRQLDGTDPGLVISTAGLVSVQHALVARGLVSKVITAFAGDNYPAPRPNPRFQEAVAEGRIELENWSLYTLIARLMGGALGVDFFPVTSLRNSDLAREHQGARYAEVNGLFEQSESTAVVRSYRPDVVVLQAVAADRFGNAVMAAPFGEALWGALAAKVGVIVCAERIVEPGMLREYNQMTIVPAHVVRAVCEVPFGSHPYGLYQSGVPDVASYTQDEAFIVDLQRRSRDADSFDRWVDEWVIEVGSHEGYLRKLGEPRLSGLRGDAVRGGWELSRLLEPAEEAEPSADPPIDTERMVVAASRVIARRVRERGHQALLAGVGYANLAAWLAARTLQDEGGGIDLMAEIGMFGYDPRPGDPFIFALRNLPSCSVLTDVTAVLGAFVGGPATQCIGAVGSGQIDRHGRINSTWGADGRYLVGSGGANDIASNAAELVVTVKHSPDRLVEEVSYATTPGDRVHTIVTTEGVLERVDGEFELRRWFPRDGESEVDAVARIVAQTGWALRVSGELEEEPPPTPQELRVIRQFDPRRTFLR
jgi:acyl CoA:acetate/3-ketoacid CoA transferase alpha subunit